jgi:hypothetical protein
MCVLGGNGEFAEAGQNMTQHVVKQSQAQRRKTEGKSPQTSSSDSQHSNNTTPVSADS